MQPKPVPSPGNAEGGLIFKSKKNTTMKEEKDKELETARAKAEAEHDARQKAAHQGPTQFDRTNIKRDPYDGRVYNTGGWDKIANERGGSIRG